MACSSLCYEIIIELDITMLGEFFTFYIYLNGFHFRLHLFTFPLISKDLPLDLETIYHCMGLSADRAVCVRLLSYPIMVVSMPSIKFQLIYNCNIMHTMSAMP